MLLIPLPQLRYLPFGILTPYEANPRDIQVEEFEELKRMMKEDPGFFLRRPCLINFDSASGTHRIYAGNQRYRAALELGYTEIPCFVDTDLPEEVMRQRCLRDNRHNGTWDWDKLGNEWQEAELLDAGFKDHELHLYFSENESEEKPEQGYKIKYDILFDSEEQQQAWYDHLAQLKKEYPDMDTVAERITHYNRKNRENY